MTAQDLGKLTAAMLVKSAGKAAPVMPILERLGGGALNLVKNLAGSRTYERLAVPAKVRQQIARAGAMRSKLWAAQQAGTNKTHLAMMQKRLARAQSLADMARARHRSDIGSGIAGMGAGLGAGLLFDQSSSPPPGYIPGYGMGPRPF
jgi:hypothetical protein